VGFPDAETDSCGQDLVAQWKHGVCEIHHEGGGMFKADSFSVCITTFRNPFSKECRFANYLGKLTIQDALDV